MKKKKKETAWRVVFSFLRGMFIIIISSRLGELLSHYRVYSSSSFIIHLLCPSWDIDILDTPFYYESPKSSYFSIVTIRSEKWEINQDGPELNHDYISYSDIKRLNIDEIRGSGPFISLDHVRIRRPIESAFSWMLYRNPPLFLSSTDKGSSRVTSAISFFFFILFSFRYGNAMQEVGNLVVSDDEKSFYLMWNLWKPEMSVMLEDDLRHLMVRCRRSVYLWKLRRRE